MRWDRICRKSYKTKQAIVFAFSWVDPVDEFFQSIFVTFFEILTLGLVDVRADDNRDFRIDYCTVDIHLFREIPGTLSDSADGGKVTASTSDSVQVRYEP